MFVLSIRPRLEWCDRKRSLLNPPAAISEAELGSQRIAWSTDDLEVASPSCKSASLPTPRALKSRFDRPDSDVSTY